MDNLIMRARSFLVPFLLILLGAIALGDEGMWLFNAFPEAKINAKYGFEPDQKWLENIQLSSVRLGDSGSFVSPEGLVLTNQHVGAQCIHNLSTAQHDYLKDGFYARSRDQELRCPGTSLSVLQAIRDITGELNAALAPGLAEAAAAESRRTAIASIESQCNHSTGLNCRVVAMYAGAIYHLYEYKRYDDVRLVFAPEFDVAFFGGDADNFTYPRYCLDIAIFRVYEDGHPVHPQHFLKWSKTSLKAGDLVFVAGNPGGTNRLKTVAQLEFLRDVQYPLALASIRQQIVSLQRFSGKSAQNARSVERELFALQNALKSTNGYRAALLDEILIAQKSGEERELRNLVAKDSRKKVQFGDPWAEIETAIKIETRIFCPLSYIERLAGFRGQLARYARDLVRVSVERTKANENRLPEYRDSAMASLRAALLDSTAIDKSLEVEVLAESLEEMRDNLGPEDPQFIQQVLGSTSPLERARELIQATSLDQPAVRKQLLDGGESAIQSSKDPLIFLMRSIDGKARALRQEYDLMVSIPERHGEQTIAKVRFAEKGMEVPPDATGTLRLSYGVVKGYTAAHHEISEFTTLGGAFNYELEHGARPPYHLPPSWNAKKGVLKLKTPLNFVCTADTIGGSSGSPVVNKFGEFVGIAFDINLESLSWRFGYQDRTGRTIAVDARGIEEALRTIYGATGLADELTSRTNTMP